jgi:hypothetical protein
MEFRRLSAETIGFVCNRLPVFDTIVLADRIPPLKSAIPTNGVKIPTE